MNKFNEEKIMFLKSDYEKLAESLETSEEILYAIEELLGENFVIDEETGEMENNNAYRLWADGDEKKAVLRNLPIENGGSPIPEETEVFWGSEGKFAEFEGEVWIYEV